MSNNLENSNSNKPEANQNQESNFFQKQVQRLRNFIQDLAANSPEWVRGFLDFLSGYDKEAAKSLTASLTYEDLTDPNVSPVANIDLNGSERDEIKRVFYAMDDNWFEANLGSVIDGVLSNIPGLNIAKEGAELTANPLDTIWEKITFVDEDGRDRYILKQKTAGHNINYIEPSTWKKLKNLNSDIGVVLTQYLTPGSLIAIGPKGRNKKPGMQIFQMPREEFYDDNHLNIQTPAKLLQYLALYTDGKADKWIGRYGSITPELRGLAGEGVAGSVVAGLNKGNAEQAED